MLVRFLIHRVARRLNAEKRFRLEVLNGVVPLHHQPQHRGLYTADGIHALLALLLVGQGIKTGKINAVEPVRPLAGEGGMRQAAKLTIVLGSLDGLCHGRRSQVVDQDSLHRTGGTGVADDFVHQQLAFPVRIAGMDNGLRPADQRLQYLELLAYAVLGHHLPAPGKQGQIFLSPFFPARVVLAGFRRFQ